MTCQRTRLFKAALKTLSVTRADRVVSPLTGGNGVIFMGHNVAPDPGHDFEPNRILRITPQFLDAVIGETRRLGFDIVPLDEVPQRLADARQAGSRKRPFACFTFDDGYRDNIEHALPVFEKHNAPFTIYVPADYADGSGDLWWLTLERAIRAMPVVEIEIDGAMRRFETATAAGKQQAHHEIYWWLRRQPEARARTIINDLAETAGVADPGLCRRLVADWDMLRSVADHPLLTIGAHTCSHRALAKLSEAECRREMIESIARIEDELATPCHHFAFPYGSADAAGPREFKIAGELGLATAVTTRKGLLYSDHANDTAALPRLSLNGDYQDLSYVRTLLSGLPFALMHAAAHIKTRLAPVPAQGYQALS